MNASDDEHRYDPIEARGDWGERQYRCTKHNAVLSALRPCEACSPKSPKQVDIALVDLPEYWVRSTYGHERRAVLFCRYHKQHFELDEACWRCVREDAERASSRA